MDDYQVEDQDFPKFHNSNKKRQLLKLLKQLLLMSLPFVIVAIILATLLLMKKDSEVEINLQVSQVRFGIDEQSSKNLLHSDKLASLTLKDFRTLNLGLGRLEIATSIDQENGIPEDWQRIETNKPRLISIGNDGRITLEGVRLKQLDMEPGSEMCLSAIKSEPNLLRICIDGAETNGVIEISESLILSCDYCEIEGSSVNYSSPSKILRFTIDHGHDIRDIMFLGQSRTINLSMNFIWRTSDIDVFDGKVIYISEPVEFFEGNDPMNSRKAGLKKDIKSTIEGGKIKIGSQEKQVDIRTGDFVILGNSEDFFLRKLSIKEGIIDITFFGSVGKLKTGPRFHEQNRLPSILEWLYACNPLVIYLTIFGSIIVMILWILKQLKIIKNKD